jgi:predicted nucleotidyltransferase
VKAREDLVKTLKALKPQIMAQFKVREIALFGSYVREQQGEQSDIDVLVDFTDEASLFDLVRLGLFLEDQFHRKVDVIPKESLRAELRESVLREMVTV